MTASPTRFLSDPYPVVAWRGTGDAQRLPPKKMPRPQVDAGRGVGGWVLGGASVPVRARSICAAMGWANRSGGATPRLPRGRAGGTSQGAARPRPYLDGGLVGDGVIVGSRLRRCPPRRPVQAQVTSDRRGRGPPRSARHRATTSSTEMARAPLEGCGLTVESRPPSRGRRAFRRPRAPRRCATDITDCGSDDCTHTSQSPSLPQVRAIRGRESASSGAWTQRSRASVVAGGAPLTACA
jgi:hypothetical protein